ncbi:conserved hypothetical protein [Candidatus Glomeribacter gigasporarum BEG34]|uniref:Uncharacterized protein n=1 Tax=Candidatus Glomeribacter gigasporarum BEG34 TaxID=1070319 RepID=G2JAX1_9BURK|nr:hypothetical protein [Candidatus Glomeribacter gigasporarum]CCD29923.1 conserved hypothetical protein [Candidatus Glomeribacter gigasporarum BEG34]
MQQIIHVEETDVRRRLAELGLESQALLEALCRGYMALILSTPNYPPLYASFAAWANTVCTLREYLTLQGWDRRDENNYSLIVDKRKEMAIAVSTGDEGTGRPDMNPTTKSSKGPNTVDAVTTDQLQLELPLGLPDNPVPVQPVHQKNRWVTWIFLVHWAMNEIRCELSLPVLIGDTARPSLWKERILLKPVPKDSALKIIPSTLPSDIEVEIKRRA